MLFHIVRADFLERVRRSSFLIVLGLAAWLAFETYRGNVVLYVDNVRGEYNSAWLGALMTMVTTTFLSLFGFYVVKNAISRDVQTGVGEVLAATPMSKWMYIAGKTLSNCAVLFLMVAVLALGALAMRLAVGVGTGLDLWKLLAPFVFIALPTMALVAAIAIFFEVVPWLRGGLGNAAYFWIWSGVLAVFFISQQDDPMGFVVHMKSMEKALPPLLPPGHSWSLTVGPHRDLGRFHWDGIDWTAAVLLSRAKWIGIAGSLAAFAALFFDRFDPERRALPKLLQRAEREVGAESVMPGG